MSVCPMSCVSIVSETKNCQRWLLWLSLSDSELGFGFVFAATYVGKEVLSVECLECVSVRWAFGLFDFWWCVLTMSLGAADDRKFRGLFGFFVCPSSSRCPRLYWLRVASASCSWNSWLGERLPISLRSTNCTISSKILSSFLSASKSSCISLSASPDLKHHTVHDRCNSHYRRRLGKVC